MWENRQVTGGYQDDIPEHPQHQKYLEEANVVGFSSLYDAIRTFRLDFNMKLTKNFYRDEFSCHDDCGFDTVDHTLLEVLQDARDYFKKPIQITSGCRCEKHNAKIGGAKRSQHLLGRAADIVVKDVDPEVVQEYFRNNPKVKGLGCYKTFTHVDTRTSDKQIEWDGNH